MQNSDNKYTAIVPAVDQACQVLLYLSTGPSSRINLTEICRNVGIHKSKGYSILNTLQQYGFIEKDPDNKQYFLGPGLIALSRKVLDNLNSNELIIPHLKDLSQKTQSTALYGLISGNNVFVVAKEESNQSIGITIRIGHRFPISWGAHGKAIVAFMEQAGGEKILKKDKLYFHGKPGNLDRTRLRRELNECREKGFAVDFGELSNGINAVASPIFAAGSKLIGVLFVMGTFREALAEEYGHYTADSAKKISHTLGA